MKRSGGTVNIAVGAVNSHRIAGAIPATRPQSKVRATLTPDEASEGLVFSELMKRYGIRDYIVVMFGDRFMRYEHYTDGGWLEGIRLTDVIYWGA